jgi:nucleotide-binding universal stress UspA family protein
MTETKIIVGVDDSDRARDALVLARELAPVLGARLDLVCAYAYSTPYAVMAYGALGRKDFEEDMERPAHDAVRDATDTLGEDVETTIVRASSPPHGLDQIAREHDAEMIVVGSTHRGRLGRITPGSVAERLLAGAPCAVGVAPAGFSAEPPHSFRVVGVAFDGSHESRQALALAARIATSAGATLRVISVVEFLELAGADRDAAPPPPADQLIESAEHKVDTALAELDFNGRAERKVELGLPAGILADESASVDLMVCGSRGYGLVRQVLLGGVSTRLIRSATCPVVVTPRSATHD